MSPRLFPRLLVLSALLVLLAAYMLVAPAPVSAQSEVCNPAPGEIETGRSEHTLSSGGLERFYIVYVPTTYDPTEPVPLVLTLHGFAGNAAQQEDYSDWNDIAERENFIAVHPQGTQFPLRWHPYRSDVSYMRRGTVDDVQFFRDLIAQLSEDYCIDPTRIYVNGLSNGGGMSYRLACELSDQIAAVGVVAGAVAVDPSCQPSRPVPLMAFHGTEDPIVEYEGNDGLTGVETWIEGWAEYNGCDSTPLSLEPQGDVSGVAYGNCDDGADVILYTVDGGGHTWPNASGLPRLLVGATTQEIDATETLWQFFLAHPLR